MEKSLIAAAIQIDQVNDKEQNIKKALKMLSLANERGAKLACFHEYFPTEGPQQGESKENLLKRSEPIPGPTTKKLAEKAKQLGMYVISGTLIENEDKKLYNTSVLIGPNGEIVGKYRKTHPENASLKNEVSIGISAGESYPVFNTDIGKIGVMISEDGVASEVPRILMLNGAEIIVWQIGWSVRWMHYIQPIAQTYAIVNKCYLICSNRVGSKETFMGKLTYPGGACIVNPEGCVMSSAPLYYEGMAVAEIDLTMVKKWREEIIPRDYPLRRRPETYSIISK